MRRFIGLVLMAALLAPALAVCAGDTRPVATSHQHDCCPKDRAVLTSPGDSRSAQSACCRMSSEAGQRSAERTVGAVPTVAYGEVVAGWVAVSLERPLPVRDVMPDASPHIARHLLLSVLLV